MVRIEIRFPLGVYHALSAESFGRAEWPPSPVRLVGALLAAAHESEVVNTEQARATLQRLCEATPPEIVAPYSASSSDDPADRGTTVAEIRGASRWAPRNHQAGELKKKGISPRNISRERTEVYKGGMAIGDQAVEIRWPNLELTPDEFGVLLQLAEEVTFLGTSRSPAILSVWDTGPSQDHSPVWRPAAGEAFSTTEVRVPIPSLLASFDARHEARRSTGKKLVDNANHVPNTAMGSTIPYMPVERYLRLVSARPFDPEHWGDMIILELDGSNSELRPKAAASYLIARSFREALLSTYDPVGSPGEAPLVLRGHEAQPHVAIVPLPFVGSIEAKSRASADGVSKTRVIKADGLIRGFAVIFPHESRLPDVAQQRLQVETGLRKFVLEGRKPIEIPGAGSLYLKLTAPNKAPLETLREPRYRQPSHVWQTVTPVVHARRRTSTGPRGLERQIAVDCAHADLPAPVQIDVLENAPFGGSPERLLPDRAIPERWRASQQGPRSHLRLVFDRPIAGPVILGRARHFGLGLFLPHNERGAGVQGESRLRQEAA